MNNVVLYQQMTELAKMLGITPEQAFAEALSEWMFGRGTALLAGKTDRVIHSPATTRPWEYPL